VGLAIAFAVWLAMWTYGAMSLKAMVAFGLTAAIVLLVFILLELQRRRA
jgi:hypothetical protein